jgi:uncharacterized protein
MTRMPATCLAEGTAEGPTTVLAGALSFWGGFDLATGRIVDRSHDACGQLLTGRVLVMPSGRGSSSASSVLAEAIRVQTAPAGILLAEPDSILAVGAIVAQKLYGIAVPIVVCDSFTYAQVCLSAWIRIAASRSGTSYLENSDLRADI